MSTLFLHNDYKENVTPDYCVRPERSVNWQQEHYKLAAHFADKFGVTSIIDIGAGDGKKTEQYFPSCKKYAIEYGENFHLCKQTIPATFEHDLEGHIRIDDVVPTVMDYGIVCIDVIEHLINPIPLLESVSCNDSCKFVFITTPERELVHGIGNMGPPTNLCHVREWKLTEFQKLIRYHCMTEPQLGLIGNEGKLNGIYALFK